MRSLKDRFKLLFQPTSATEDITRTTERMGWEIKGSIFTLLSIFVLVSLTSYVPLDSFNIFQGRIDHINNLGGIVGALVAEWLFGMVGIAAYSLVLLMASISISYFRRIAFRNHVFKFIGCTLGSCLTAMALHILLSESFPEASLFQGGWIGKTVGHWIETLFNRTGALIIVGFTLLVTILISTDFSIANFVRIFSAKDEDAETEPNDEYPEDSFTPVSLVKSVPKPTMQIPKAIPIQARRRRRKGAHAKTETESEATQLGSEPLAEDSPSLKKGELVTASIPTSGEFQELIPFEGGYSMPSTRLLKNISDGSQSSSRGQLKKNAQKITEHLLSFQITGEMEAITEGPVVTTYEYKPSAGVKLSKIAALQEDLGVVLGSRELRIIAPIPGKTVVGIEVPRTKPEIVSLKDLIGEDKFFDKKLKIPICIGKSTFGDPIFSDLTSMPHLLVAGATGTGKSVFINTLVTSMLFRLTPQQLRLILIDPKMLELNVFDGIPHLISKVITDNQAAYNSLAWAVMEMERRYGLMAKTGSKNIESYNSKKSSPLKKLPYIVVVIDELADLMFSGGEDVEIAITRLAQKARAAGIHLVIATQRPSTDVITGLIKANIPSRISFKVPSGVDSRTILDAGGAEELIGRGDMLMLQPGIPICRMQGCYITEEELVRVVKYATGGRNHSKYYIDFPAPVRSEES